MSAASEAAAKAEYWERVACGQATSNRLQNAPDHEKAAEIISHIWAAAELILDELERRGEEA